MKKRYEIPVRRTSKTTAFAEKRYKIRRASKTAAFAEKRIKIRRAAKNTAVAEKKNRYEIRRTAITDKPYEGLYGNLLASQRTV